MEADAVGAVLRITAVGHGRYRSRPVGNRLLPMAKGTTHSPRPSSVASTSSRLNSTMAVQQSAAP